MTSAAQACMNCLTKNVGICLSLADKAPQEFSELFIDKIKTICRVCEKYFAADKIATAVYSRTKEAYTISFMIRGENGPLIETASASLNGSFPTENVLSLSSSTLPYVATAIAIGLLFYCCCSKQKQD